MKRFLMSVLGIQTKATRKPLPRRAHLAIEGLETRLSPSSFSTAVATQRTTTDHWVSEPNPFGTTNPDDFQGRVIRL